MAERNVRLFNFPASYYSQKALIALKEKEVQYESVFVDIHAGEQDNPWYVRLNPAGLVPLLQDGEKYIKESEDIVEYVDREFPTDSKLIPDTSTELGKEVAKWRKLINDIPIELVTYGVLFHPDLSATGPKVSSTMMKKNYMSSPDKLAKLQALADEHPDLREAYMAKVAKQQKRNTAWNDREGVVKILDDLETTMDNIEAQLSKVDADPAKELWLCGQQFTAADINLCILLGRLELLGLSKRYFTTEKRPKTLAYWEVAKKRSTIRNVTINAVRNVMKFKLGRSLKKVLPVVGGLVTIGLAAGLAFALAQKR